MILVPRGSQNQPKWCPGALRTRSWKQVGSGTPKKWQGHTLLDPLWAPFGRSWAPFWAPLGAKGSPNQTFWHQDAPKSQNMTSRMRHQNKFEIWMESRSENEDFWMCWIHRNALYISISVVLTHYIKIKNFIENWYRHEAQNALKSTLGAQLFKFWNCKPKNGNWNPENGRRKWENGSSEAGKWCPEVSNRWGTSQYPEFRVAKCRIPPATLSSNILIDIL